MSDSVHRSCVQHCDFTSLLKRSLPTKKFVKSCKFFIHNYVIDAKHSFYLNIKKSLVKKNLFSKHAMEYKNICQFISIKFSTKSSHKKRENPIIFYMSD